jgi:glycosyltransferase involved in cell wall biosynthesis
VAVLRSAVELLLARSPAVAGKLQLHFVGKLSAAEQAVLAPLAGAGIVRLWGHQPRARALGFQQRADVLLLVTVPDQASIVTGKLFEYLAARKPILALTRGTEAARIVRESNAGVVVAPDDQEAIARALERCVATGGELPTHRDEEQVAAFSRSRQMAALAARLTSPDGPVRARPASRPGGAPSGTGS